VLALGAACVFLPIVASSALAFTPQALERTSQMQRWRRLQLPHADVARGCDDTAPLGRRRGGACSWLVNAARGRAVLIGDSNAGQFTEPFVRASRRVGLDATVATLSSCPFVDLRVVGPTIGEADCHRFVEASLAELVRLRPRVVVIAARTDRYVESSDFGLATARGAVTYSPDAKARLWQQGFESLLRVLGRAGIPAVVVHPVPSFSIDPGDCAVVRVLTGTCGDSRARAAVDRELRRSLRAEVAAVADAPGASAADFERVGMSPARAA
jgi:SGNH domain (fused to AT3 domains)